MVPVTRLAFTLQSREKPIKNLQLSMEPQTTGLHLRKTASTKQSDSQDIPATEQKWSPNVDPNLETKSQEEQEAEKAKHNELMRKIRTRNKRLVEKYLIMFFIGAEIFFIINFVFSYTLTGTVFWGFGDMEPNYVEITAQQRRIPLSETLITHDQLRAHDGTDPSLPIYVAIGGKVFDVTHNKKLYAPGGGFHYLAGRDVTQAFLEPECTASKHHDCLKPSILTPEQQKKIQYWIDFFHDHEGYVFVGHLETVQE